MKLKLVDFWPGAKVKQTFVFRALTPHLNASTNLTVYSVFRSRLLLETGKLGRVIEKFLSKARDKRLERQYSFAGSRNIWWTGENIRPPLEQKFHHFVSFDQDRHSGRNTYFPLFYIEATLPSAGTLERVGLSSFDASQLLKPRLVRHSDFDSRKLACVFINNPEPTRLAAIRELSKYGQVDVYGRYSDRPVGSKFAIAANYKFVLCFENDLYPGYVTEKLLDAYLCDVVPLYWGDLGREPHINRKSFLNLKDFPSLEEFAKVVANMDADHYYEIYSQPLLESVPPVKPLVEALLGTREFKNES
jgi:hypothetical protein